MSRELTILVGVIAEKRKSVSRWATDYWIPVGVTPSVAGLSEGDVMYSDETTTRYFMGVTDITCHAAETEAYVHNFNSRDPALYVILRKDHEGKHPLAWFLHAVTASPYVAQDHEDVAEDIVERVAIPREIEESIKLFLDRWHKEEEFLKRKRGPKKEEREKFGKEPIFLNRQKPSGGLDG